MIRRAAILGTVAMLAACGQGGGNSTAGGSGPAVGPLGGGGAAGVTLQPGQWETTMQVDAAAMPDLPPGVTPPAMPPMTTRICITPEQAANPGAEAMAGNAQQPAGCRTENFSFANGRISGTSICNTGGVEARTTISGQFTPTTYEMTMQTATETGGAQRNSTMRITARRLGDCPAP